MGPVQYLKFSGFRNRPAIDLLMKINHSKPKLVYDLGSGPRNITGFFQHNWPNADVIVGESSPDMLEEAHDKYPDNRWIWADLNDWVQDSPDDILYLNLVFQ